MALPSNTASWTKAQYQSASAADIGALSNAQVAAMLHPDWLLPAGVAGFTASQIPSISINWTYMTASWLNALSATAFAAVPTTSIAQFSSTAVAGLDVTHVQTLSLAQVSALKSPQSLSLAGAASLSAAQVVAINVSWGNMSGAWLNVLSATAFAAIAPAGVGQFSKAASAGLDVAHVQMLSLAQMAKLYYPEALSLAAVAALTPAQVAAIGTSWYWMSPAWVNALTLDAFAAIPTAGIAALASATVTGLDTAHLQTLSAVQLGSLSLGTLTASQVAVLSAPQLASIAASRWYWLGAAWINAIPVSVFQTLPAASVGQFTGTTVAGLDAAHVQALSAAQLNTIGLSSLSGSQVALLSADQLANIGASRWYWLSAAWINAIPVSVFQTLPAASVGQFSSATVAGLDVAHVQALTLTQMAALYYPESLSLAAVAALTPAQVAAISTDFYWMSASWLNALSLDTFAAIPPAAMGRIFQTAMGGLDAAHVKMLTANQLNSMWCLGSLNAQAIGALSTTQVAALSVDFWYWTAPEWMNSLSVDTFASLSPAAIAKFRATAIAGLDNNHIAALTTVQVVALSTSQIAALTPSQIAALTPADIAVFSAKQLAALSGAQIGALSATQFAALSTGQISALSPTQVAALSASSLTGLGAAQLAAFDANIRYLSPAAIAQLPASLIQQMSCAQLSDLAPAQIAALSAQQLAALSVAQVSYLTPGQLTALAGKVQYLSNPTLAGLSYASLIQVYTSLSPAQVASLSAAQLAAVQQAGTVVSTLLGQLTDASVLAQVQAVLNSGESLFSYDGLLKVLNGVDAALGSSGLTQAQLADLKTLTAAVGSAEGSTSYLYQILNNTVNGNRANATWTGGAASSTSLGNLAVGSSAAQLGLLSSKWFLGLDLPTWSAAGIADYKLVDAPLFSVAGPLASDVTQGGIGDCYLMASMVSVAQDESGLLKSMFTDNGNGTYGVRMYSANQTPVYVTVNNQLPGWVGSSASKDNWVSLLEKAFVEYNVTVNGVANAYASISGGWASGLTAIAGKTYSNYMSYKYQTVDAWGSAPKASVIQALSAGEEVMFGSFLDSKDALNGKTDLVSGHMFSVLGYDSADDEFILRNPWGNGGGSGWNGVFEVSMDQLWGGTSGTSSSSGFVVAKGSAPSGATDPKYAVSQLIQAMATASISSSADTTPLAGSTLNSQQAILLAASV